MLVHDAHARTWAGLVHAKLASIPSKIGWGLERQIHAGSSLPCSHGARSCAKRKRGRTKHYWNTLSSPFSVHWRQFKHVHILLRYIEICHIRGDRSMAQKNTQLIINLSKHTNWCTKSYKTPPMFWPSTILLHISIVIFLYEEECLLLTSGLSLSSGLRGLQWGWRVTSVHLKL